MPYWGLGGKFRNACGVRRENYGAEERKHSAVKMTGIIKYAK